MSHISASEPPWWPSRRLKTIVRLRRTRLSQTQEELRHLSLSAYTGVTDKEFDDENQVRTQAALQDYQLVEPNDLVTNPMWLLNGGLAISKKRGVVSPAYRVYTPSSEVDPDYLHYLLKSEPYVQQYNRLIRGLTTYDRSVTREDFEALQVPMPPLPVQQQLAAYLERETSRIDLLIASKERLLALLDEQRQTLTSSAVTKGLDPTAPTKDSGISWIGPMNADWQVVRTKYLCRLTTGVRDTQDAEPEAEFPFYVRSPIVLRASTSSFSGEAVLTAGDGEGGVGKVFHHHREGRFEAHQRVYVFYKFSRAVPRFFYYYLRAHLRRVTLAGTAETTHASLRRPMLIDFPGTLPSIDAQRAIVRKLDEAAAHAEAFRGKMASSLALLRERRQSLVATAVTGHFDPSVHMPRPEEAIAT